MKILKFDPGGSYKLKKFSLIATIFILIASFLFFGSEARQWQVAADNPDSLVFHSGFEMGDFGEWSGGVTIGSPEVQSDIKKTGDYAMRVNVVNSTGYVVPPTALRDKPKKAFYFRIATAPNIECRIAGSVGDGVNLRLTSDRYLKLYVGDTPEGTSSSQLSIDTWYRISASSDGTNSKVYIDGVEEISASTEELGLYLGVILSATTDLYFDDFVIADSTGSTADVGDIRVLRASPNAAGEYTEFNSYNGSATHWENVDEVPADDADYNWHDTKTAVKETYNLQDASTIGLISDDTIKAVSTWARMSRGTAGGGTYNILVRDTSDFETQVSLGTTWGWFNCYNATKPSGGDWTQSAFDSFEVGMSYNGKGGVPYISTVMVMVAYSPPEGPPLSSAIEIRAQDYETAVTNITFPEAAPGAVVSNPYNDQGETQTFGNPAESNPVVTLCNNSTDAYTIWYNITPFTEGIVANEYYLINVKNDACADEFAITNAVTFDTSTNTATTIAAGAEKDLYLKITLSEVAGKSGTSTLTILGETV